MLRGPGCLLDTESEARNASFRWPALEQVLRLCQRSVRRCMTSPR